MIITEYLYSMIHTQSCFMYSNPNYPPSFLLVCYCFLSHFLLSIHFSIYLLLFSCAYYSEKKYFIIVIIYTFAVIMIFLNYTSPMDIYIIISETIGNHPFIFWIIPHSFSKLSFIYTHESSLSFLPSFSTM